MSVALELESGMLDYHTIFSQRGDRYQAAMEEQPAARARELAFAARLGGPQAGETVLDLPAGGGYLRPYLPDGVRLIGVEGCAPFGEQTVHTTDLGAVPLPDRVADVVICLAAAHHVPDELRLYREVRRLLRQGGRFVLVDAQEGGRIAGFLDGFVGPHNGMGHAGRYLGLHSGARLEEARLGVVDDEARPCPWEFSDEVAMVRFCRQLFGLVGVGDAEVLAALTAGIGVGRAGGSVWLDWELRMVVSVAR